MKKQYIMIDLTNLDDIKHEINISGLNYQFALIETLNQVITQVTEQSQKATRLIINCIIDNKEVDEDSFSSLQLITKKLYEVKE